MWFIWEECRKEGTNVLGHELQKTVWERSVAHEVKQWERTIVEMAECGCSELFLGEKSLMGKVTWVWRDVQVFMY